MFFVLIYIEKNNIIKKEDNIIICTILKDDKIKDDIVPILKPIIKYIDVLTLRIDVATKGINKVIEKLVDCIIDEIKIPIIIE